MTLGVEVTVVPSLKPDAPDLVRLPISLPFVQPTITVDQSGGHATVFTTNVRLEMPGHSARLPPYVVGGGGVGVVSEHLSIDFEGLTSPPALLA